MKTDRGWQLVYAVCTFLAILLFGPVSLHAQQSTGTILGTVLDSSGAAVPGAQITITNQDTGTVRNVVSTADGLYNVPQVAAGNYTIEATAQGFGPAEVKDVTVIVATDTRVDLKLQVGSVSQTVTVSEASAPLIDTTTSSVGGTVDEQRVADLPLNGRNWTDLTLLQPGIALVQITAMSGNAVLAGYNGTVFISNGATDRSNQYSLDGASMVNFAGLNNSSMSNTSLGVDGIKEYKVITSMFSAEYGLRMGSQTTIVSKGGTNQFHGDAFEYLRNSSLDARNYFDALDTTNSNGFGTNKSLPYPGKRIPPFRRNNFGGSFGGPIKKDKTFFQVGYEGIQQAWAGNAGLPITLTTLPKACFVDQTGTLQAKVPAKITNSNPYGTCVTGTVNSAAVPSVFSVDPLTLPFADLYPQPNVTGNPSFNYTFAYVQPTTEHWGQARLDQTISASDNAFFRYTHDDADSVSSASFPGFVTDRHSGSQFLTAAENHVFTPSLLNSARFSYSRTLVSTEPTDVAPATVSPNLQLVVNTPIGNVIGGATPGGGPTAIGTGATFSIAGQNIYSWSDDVLDEEQARF